MVIRDEQIVIRNQESDNNLDFTSARDVSQVIVNPNQGNRRRGRRLEHFMGKG
jgi:hypothetical protein